MTTESQALIDLASDDEEVEYCLHFQEKKDLEKNLGVLSAKKCEIESTTEKIVHQLGDFEEFFDQFGADNQHNEACQLIESENEQKWHKYYLLGEELVHLNSQIDDIKKKLQDIDELARNENCFCAE